MPLNRLLNFNLDHINCRPQQFLSRFTKLAGDWLSTLECPRAHLWVIEEPPMRHLNAHLLFHVPSELNKRFKEKEKGWAVKAGITLWTSDALESQPLGIPKGRRFRELGEGEYLVHLENTLGYMLKGGDPDACQTLKLERQKFQGVITGKRAAVSESIGRNARKGFLHMPPESERYSLIFRWRCRLDQPRHPSERGVCAENLRS
jgi:hypothetical protein